MKWMHGKAKAGENTKPLTCLRSARPRPESREQLLWHAAARCGCCGGGSARRPGVPLALPLAVARLPAQLGIWVQLLLHGGGRGIPRVGRVLAVALRQIWGRWGAGKFRCHTKMVLVLVVTDPAGLACSGCRPAARRGSGRSGVDRQGRIRTGGQQVF